MPATLEDHERRIAVLEKAAETENSIVRAVSKIISESEQRITGRIDRLTARVEGCETGISQVRTEMSGFRVEMKAETQRLSDRISDTERRVIDVVNDKFDAVVATLDRLHNPPK